MKQYGDHVVTVARGYTTWRSVWDHSMRRGRASLACLGIIGLIISAEICTAQTLSVRPHEMATGTRTLKAGEQSLDSDSLLKDYLIYVPKQCVGKRRCPLIVFVHGGGGTPRQVMNFMPAVADKYGMIVLAPANANYMDTALKQVLHNFAIDPDKIAVVGISNGGGYALGHGSDNPDIFSRVGGMSPSSGLSSTLTDPRHSRNQQFFLSTGILETDWFTIPFSSGAEEARKAGYPVKQALIMRTHGYDAGECDLFGRWLQESWAKPDPATRKTPPTFAADSIPLLTLDALTKMTIFWTGFMQEPDSISQIAREEHRKEIIVPIGQDRGSLLMMDTRALAAKYPSVAADLKKAGLTAQQAEAYRVALITARATKQGVGQAGIVDSTSVIGRNMAFRHAHPDELKALAKTGMWLNP